MVRNGLDPWVDLATMLVFAFFVNYFVTPLATPLAIKVSQNSAIHHIGGQQMNIPSSSERLYQYVYL